MFVDGVQPGAGNPPLRAGLGLSPGISLRLSLCLRLSTSISVPVSVSVFVSVSLSLLHLSESISQWVRQWGSICQRAFFSEHTLSQAT